MNSPRAAGLVLHPQPPGCPASAEYAVTVDGRPVFVHRQLGFSGGTLSWTGFDCDGPVEVRVTAMRNVGRGNRRIDSVEVLPRSAGATARLEGSTVVLRVPGPCRLVLRFDDDRHLPFHIFADPVERHAPRAGDPGVIWYGPGVHRPGMIRLGAGETLYLAAGAVVHGVVRAVDADGARIAGHGILSGSTVRHGGTDEFPDPMVEFRRCRDVRVEGVTLLDSYGWTLVAHHCDGWRVSGVKILNERGWSTDGINPCNCRDVVIEDCFVRAKDDCVSIKGLEDQSAPATWTPMHDITVRRCVFWSENNNAVVVGSETRASVIERIRIEDCDIIASSYTCGDDAGALAVICLDDTVIQDLDFERIRIHRCHGPAINVFHCDEIFGIPGSRRPGGGILRRLRFRDITVDGGIPRASFLRGLDERHLIEDVTIAGMRWHGTAVRTVADLRLVCEHVRGLTIV